jgi:hypothetical protein
VNGSPAGEVAGRTKCGDPQGGKKPTTQELKYREQRHGENINIKL